MVGSSTGMAPSAAQQVGEGAGLVACASDEHSLAEQGAAARTSRCARCREADLTDDGEQRRAEPCFLDGVRDARRAVSATLRCSVVVPHCDADGGRLGGRGRPR